MNIKGFKVNFLGDSITEGVGVCDIPNCRYDNRIAKKLELSMNGLRVSYSGGLFKAGECALAPLREHIAQAGGQLVAPAHEPDVGAVMMAIRSRMPDFDPKTYHLQEV